MIINLTEKKKCIEKEARWIYMPKVMPYSRTNYSGKNTNGTMGS